VDVVITEWALDSYLELVSRRVFSTQEYKTTIRPDVERLKTYPSDPEFQKQNFWSPAQDTGGGVLRGGFKMKWHNVGVGNVQLRLPVGIVGDAILCQAYVKENAKQERRLLAKFKTHLQLIRMGRHTIRGRLP